MVECYGINKLQVCYQVILPVQSLYPPLQNQMAILPGEPGNNVNNNVYTMSSCFHLLLMPINMHIIFLKI